MTTGPSTKKFLQQFEEISKRNHLVYRAQKIIIAVSGGVDSVVLLDVLSKLQGKYSLQLIVAHFNHKLRRKESEDDERFVRALADQHHFLFYRESRNTERYAKSRKLSLQEAARELRYAFFEKLLESNSFDVVATAHHADDNAETVLLNLFRGAGVEGLRGIPMRREDIWVIRPLLFAERKDIEAYAKNNHLHYRTDSSNLDETYARNFVRLRLFPLVKEHLNPNIVSSLNRTANLFSHLAHLLERDVRKQLEKVIQSRGAQEIHLDVKKLERQPLFIQERIILLSINALVDHQVDFIKVQKILDLIHAATGKQIRAFKDLVVYRDRERLIVQTQPQAKNFAYTIQPNRQYELNGFQFSSEFVSKDSLQFQRNPCVEFVDADRVGSQLTLRPWHKGDWLVPLGMKTRKKMSDFFINQKIPLYQKNRIPILESGGSIVWVCGVRLDERFKITDSTERVLKLEFHAADN